MAKRGEFPFPGSSLTDQLHECLIARLTRWLYNRNTHHYIHIPSFVQKFTTNKQIAQQAPIVSQDSKNLFLMMSSLYFSFTIIDNCHYCSHLSSLRSTFNICQLLVIIHIPHNVNRQREKMEVDHSDGSLPFNRWTNGWLPLENN